jgi:hypothetical protein
MGLNVWFLGLDFFKYGLILGFWIFGAQYGLCLCIILELKNQNL